MQDHSTILGFPKTDPYKSSILEMSHNTLIPATVENQLRREKTPQSKQMYRPLVPHAPDRPCIGV